MSNTTNPIYLPRLLNQISFIFYTTSYKHSPIDNPSCKHNLKMVEHPTKCNNQLSNTKYETQDDGANSETIHSVEKEAYDYGNEDVWPRVDGVENTE